MADDVGNAKNIIEDRFDEFWADTYFANGYQCDEVKNEQTNIYCKMVKNHRISQEKIQLKQYYIQCYLENIYMPNKRK